jgi:hypothetical protein
MDEAFHNRCFLYRFEESGNAMGAMVLEYEKIVLFVQFSKTMSQFTSEDFFVWRHSLLEQVDSIANGRRIVVVCPDGDIVKIPRHRRTAAAAG